MQLTITRERGAYGAARALDIYIDGEKLGKLRHKQSIVIEVPEGAREIYGKIDWGLTEKFPLSGISDGAHLIVRMWFTLHPLRMLGILDLPGRFEMAEPETEAFR